MKFGEWALEDALDLRIAHSRKTFQGKLSKGDVLTQSAIESLQCMGVSHVVGARLDPHDMEENSVAQTLVRAIAGVGLEVRDSQTGRSNLHAIYDGLVVINESAVLDFNLVDDSITLATLRNYVPVRAGQMVATVKIIPFAVPAAVVQTLSSKCKDSPECLVQVLPYVRTRVGLIQTQLPDTRVVVLDKTAATLIQRLAYLGGNMHLVTERRCIHSTVELARALRELLAENVCDLIAISAASATVDSADVVPQAIRDAGGKVERVGMPVDPGNLLVLGSEGAVPIIGMPGCARSPKLNGFDWLLQRLSAGITVSHHDIAAMGVGGLLGEIITRPQLREGNGSQNSQHITAVILAAGLSRRMGTQNKLLLPFDGEPMLRRAVRSALNSRCRRVVVVVGHDAEDVRGVLDDFNVEFVLNPAFEEGLGSSVRAGVLAAGNSSAVVMCLGDMPLVTTDVIDQLIAAYDPRDGAAVCQPTYGGKRGNPVLWGSAHFPALRQLRGDEGGRALLIQHSEAVVYVDVGDPGVLLDLDSPDDFMKLQIKAR